MGTGALVKHVEWTQSLLASQPCLLYSAQFSKGVTPGRFFAAGGSGANEARVFESSPDGDTGLVGTIVGMARGVFSVDWSPTEDRVAIGSGDGTIRILTVL